MKLEQAARQALEALKLGSDRGATVAHKVYAETKAITALREALAEQAEQEPVAIGSEWKPCMKLPVVVHVREQREGESHVSTREGITPVRPDDLIMRGVAGEEYPIGRELFNKTYTFDTAAPVQQEEQEPVAWVEVERGIPMFMNFTEDYKPYINNGIAPLYAAPVRTKDLTDDEILEITKRFALGIAFPVNGVTTPEMFARAVIAADREKNK